MKHRYSMALPVRFADTDAQGHVFFANYLTFCDEGLTGYMRAIGCDWQSLVDDGADMFYANANTNFRGRAKFGGSLDVHVRVGRIGNTSMTADFAIYDADTLVAEASLTSVFVAPDTGAPVRVPERVRAAVAKHENGGATTAPKTVELRPMTSDERATYRVSFIEDWAADLARVDNIPLALARQEAVRRTDADFATAHTDPSQRFETITVDGLPVGALWFSHGDGRAFLSDITVSDAHRGNGYGTRALALMESELATVGVDHVQLNVYSHNPRALALYKRRGYRVTGLTLTKRI